MRRKYHSVKLTKKTGQRWEAMAVRPYDTRSLGLCYDLIPFLDDREAVGSNPGTNRYLLKLFCMFTVDCRFLVRGAAAEPSCHPSNRGPGASVRCTSV